MVPRFSFLTTKKTFKRRRWFLNSHSLPQKRHSREFEILEVSIPCGTRQTGPSRSSHYHQINIM
ncbi:hypothetical protein V6Z11_A07G266800 [Gossypium hirsutum]